MAKEARGKLEKSFGEQLKAAMDKRHVSRKEIAEVLECSNQAVRNYTLGVFFPKNEKLIALEKLLKVRFIRDNPNVFEPIYENDEKSEPYGDMTIAQAKTALSKSLGVPPEKIKILIEG